MDRRFRAANPGWQDGKPRQRMSHAHELGHLSMQVADGVDEEAAARLFAGAFLYPVDAVRAEFGARRNRITADELLVAKKRWGMSIQGVLYRLRDLEVIDETGYKWWCMFINRVGWRTEEAGDEPREYSTWVKTHAHRAAAEGLIARGGRADEVGGLIAIRAYDLRTRIASTTRTSTYCTRRQVMRSEAFFDTHPVFTFDEYRASRADPGGSSSTVKNLLAGHVASGRLVRVRQGLYASVPRGIEAAEFEPDPYLIASSAAPGAAVCGHAALQFFGKSYSVWSRFHFFAAVRRRGFTFRGSTFVPLLDPAPLRSSSAREAGVLTRAHAGGMVRVCSLERTLVDVMSAPERAGGWEEVWRSLEMVEFFDLAAVIDYARSAGSALTAARVGLFLEWHAESLLVEPGDLDALREMAPLQPRYLDAAHSPGRLDARWNVIVPEWLEARAWEEAS